MKEKVILGVTKKPGQAAEINPFVGNNLPALQKIVGGYIEAVPFTDCVVICNEEGRLQKLPYNCKFRGVDFFGPILIVGADREDFASLRAAQAARLRGELDSR